MTIVRWERAIGMRLEGLWSYFTDPDRMNRWYPVEVIGFEPVLGGTVRFADAAWASGTINAYDPPQLLSIALTNAQVRFETHPEPAGQTLLVFRLIRSDDIAGDDEDLWRPALDRLVQLARDR